MDDRLCAAGHLCRGYTVVDGRRVPAMLTTPTGMCQPCQRWTRRCLRDLPHDWCKLELTLGERGADRPGGGGRRPKPGSRVPLNTTADALMRESYCAAVSAAHIVAGAINARWLYVGAPTGRAGDYRAIQAAVALVAERIDTLVDSGEEGVNAALRISDCHRRVVRHLGETQQREKQHLPCPSCGAQALVKEVQDRRGHVSAADGSATPEVIRCLACDGGPNRDGTWTEAEYQWLSTMVLSEREEHEMLKWLLAEAQWERDVAAWLAAERAQVLDVVASLLDLDVDELLNRVRGMAA